MSKNAKWITITACAAIIAFAVWAKLFTYFMDIMKGDAYKLSLIEVSKSEVVLERVGSPIEPGYMVLGTISFSNSGGGAVLQYSIKGSRSSGKVHVQANEEKGVWALERVVVVLEPDNEKILIVGGMR
jgi:Cytochrome oxidase complex assembly protein 1